MDKNSIILPKSDKNSLEAFKTGDWRTLIPEFRIKQSACQAHCPIGNNIRTCFQLAKDGELYKAWCMLLETNPLPAVLGRVCPHPCELKCLRKEFDEVLAINSFEKNLGDLALKYDWHIHLNEDQPLKGKRIAIIGAGPAGLSCAYQLRRLGCSVYVFEAEKVAGGMLALGIPSYRLPKDVLSLEIRNNILSLGGIDIHCEVSIDRLLWHNLPEDSDAVVIATGRYKSRKLNIAGEERNSKVISGLDFLRKINLGGKADIGDVVLVVGGGNTAIDSARCAKKNGAKFVFILYRRREEDMPAFKEEIEAAKKEGIEIMPLVSPVMINEWEGFLKLECIKMELGEIDDTGRPKPIPCSGVRFALIAHSMIVAVGEESDLSFIACLDDEFPPENVFVAGDARLRQGYGGQASSEGEQSEGGGTVAAAIASGIKVAQEIDMYLKTGKRRENLSSEALAKEEKIVQFSDLNREYFEYCRSVLKEHLLVNNPIEKLLKEEASRCFSCGDCNSCGNCWLYCPDVAVKETAECKYEINYDYCKGCGICANECPRNAINMEREVKQ